jgi:hypothetical protein
MTTPSTTEDGASAPSDKGQSYVPQILAAHDGVISNSQGALAYAIQAGELLNDAKETMKGKRGAWGKFCNENLPEKLLPQTTRSMYMRLAEHKVVIGEKQIELTEMSAKGSLSIRAALKLLPPRQSRGATAGKPARKIIKADMPAEAVAQALRSLFDGAFLDSLADLIEPEDADDGLGIPPNLRRQPQHDQPAAN